jgi:hypothetical protein
VNGLRVHEGHFEPEHPLPRLAVDQLGAPGCELGDRSANVVDLVGDVMHAGPALSEKLPDGRIVAERREQLDPLLADADRGSLDALVVHARTMLEAAAEEALVRGHRIVEIRDGNADVVDTSCFHSGDATGTVRCVRMGRQFSTGLLAAAVLAALASGCGGGGASNGEAAKSAAAVFSDARHAAVAAKSVHVAGALNDSGKALNLDLVLAHGKGKGTMSESGLSFQIARVGKVAYIKGTDAFLRQFAGVAAAQLFHDRWLKGPVDSGALASLAPLTDIVQLFNGAFGGSHGKLVNKGETTYKGQKAVLIVDSSDGSKLYVAATGTPYPIAAAETGNSKGAITFDHWNDSVSIDAPKGAVDMTKLGG